MQTASGRAADCADDGHVPKSVCADIRQYIIDAVLDVKDKDFPLGKRRETDTGWKLCFEAGKFELSTKIRTIDLFRF